MARLSSLAALLFGVLMTATAAAQTGREPDCRVPSLPDVSLPNGYPFDVHRAVTLFRFHRQKEALQHVDAARVTARGPWRLRVAADRRDEITSTLDALRTCLAGNQPPQLGTLTVRVFVETGVDRVGPQAGARVHVEGIEVGRTNRSGSLTVRVPSGTIHVEAEVPIGLGNSTEIAVTPGESQSIQITLMDGKEVSERTDLVLTEAVDDIVPVTAKSLTLRFMRGGRVAPVTDIDMIDVVDDEGNSKGEIGAYFRVVDGVITATNATRVLEVLAPHSDRTIVLEVQAMSSGRELHYAVIAFRVAQSPLSVTLSPPASNPGLSVSNIAVGISIPGSGVAVQRISDANGRLDVGLFPSGVVIVECVAISGGRYYYGDAVLVHPGAPSIKVVLRHVDDVVSGVSRDASTRVGGVARVLVTSAEKNVVLEMAAHLVVPRGTQQVMLAYDVRTTERRRDRAFDDVWMLSVFDANGRSLFHTARNTGSQHRFSPHWQPGDRTGRIQEMFDVTPLAAEGDVRLTLRGSAVNVGDDLYPTSVEALITATHNK